MASDGTDVIVDRTGWFTGTPRPTDGVLPTNLPPDGTRGCVPDGTPVVDGIRSSRPARRTYVAHVPAPGPRGPIAIVGDSLTADVERDLAAALHTDGWGPVCIDGAVSRTVRLSSTLPSGRTTVASIKVSDPIWAGASVTWVVALGTNDAGGHTVVADIDHLVEAIGPSNALWWVDVRTLRGGAWYGREDAFNAEVAIDGRATIVAWAAAASGRPDYFASDNIHLSAEGYAARQELLVSTLSK